MGKSSKLTASLEDYLEAIADLSEAGSAVRSSHVAERLGVKRPSVTIALRSLAEKGLVVYLPYVPISLTMKGVQEAAKVRKRHKAMEIFLVKILGIEEEKAVQYACRLEHAMDQELTTRIVEFIEFVDSCPRLGTEWIRLAEYHCREKHRDADCRECIANCLSDATLRLRSLDLSEVHRESCPLSRLDAGSTVILARIGGNAKMRTKLEKLGFVQNATIHVISPKEPITVEIHDEVVLLSEAEAKFLEVVPCD